MPEVTRKPLPDKGRDLPAESLLVAYGRRPLFGPSDEADGVRVPGHRLIRGDDGQLYAVAEPEEDR